MRAWIGAACFLLLVGAAAQTVQRTAPFLSPLTPPFTPGYVAVTGEPFTADRVVSTSRTAADGAKTQSQSTALEGRDSRGRMFSRSELVRRDTLTPLNPRVYHMQVYDPDTRVWSVWNTNSNEVTQTHYEQPRQPAPFPDPGASGFETMVGTSKYHAEALPPREIEGVKVRCIQAVQKVPSGPAHGNDRELTINATSCYSPELQIIMTAIMEDPVAGLRRFEITHLKRIEPDPAMFQLPDGYVVKESSTR